MKKKISSKVQPNGFYMSVIKANKHNDTENTVFTIGGLMKSFNKKRDFKILKNEILRSCEYVYR